MTIRVLMLGPDEGVMGGIAAWTKMVVPFLKEHCDLLYMPTVRHRPLSECNRISAQNIVLAISQYTRFLYLLLRFHPHVIHLHTSQGIGWLKDTFFAILGKAYRCKVVLHMHGGQFCEIYRSSNSLIQRYTYRISCLADAVIAVSEEGRKRLTEIVPLERVLTFKNCIALNAALPRSSNHTGNRTKALFMGMVGPSKGAFDLLRAMGYLKSRGYSLPMWVAGYEERKGDLLRASALLKELQLEDLCEFVGVVRGAKKAELFIKANFFVLPSYNEGLPIAILEAMAAGLPIIATPVGGIPEVVKDGYNGFLVAPGDVEVLAEKLAVLANDPHLCEVMGQRSREIVERELDVKPYVGRLVALYESLVKPTNKNAVIGDDIPAARCVTMNDRYQT